MTDPLYDALTASGAQVQFLDRDAEGVLIVRTPADLSTADLRNLSRTLWASIRDNGITRVSLVLVSKDLTLELLSDADLAKSGLARIEGTTH